MRVPWEKVPVADRRRAARMLESLLGMPSKNRRSLREAHFGDEVMPIHRPDLDEVAHWECS
ncbi:MAG: hypothetical protein Q4P15_11640 [Propionibacteriaceae bacterium]|nr:hypothetical protein [Propionibacteriaceae bacterium]